MFFKSFLEQPLTLKNYYSVSCKKLSLILIVWLIVILQFNAAFKSKIAALMTLPNVRIEKTLDDLISEGYGIIQEQIIKDNDVLSATREVTIYNK